MTVRFVHEQMSLHQLHQEEKAEQTQRREEGEQEHETSPTASGRPKPDPVQYLGHGWERPGSGRRVRGRVLVR
jgi:hypothetical protein